MSGLGWQQSSLSSLTLRGARLEAWYVLCCMKMRVGRQGGDGGRHLAGGQRFERRGGVICVVPRGRPEAAGSAMVDRPE